MKKPELKKCKCGGKPRPLRASGLCWVECNNCGVTTLCGPPAAVVRWWNKGEAA